MRLNLIPLYFMLSVFTISSVSMAVPENDQKQNSQKKPVMACLGKIVPSEKVLYLASPEQSSRVIKELRVKRGDMVKKDQILAITYSAVPAAASINRAKAAVELAEAKLNILKSGEPYPSVISQEAELQRAEAAMKEAKANLDFEIKDDSSRKEIHYAKTRFEELAALVQASKELLEKMKQPRKIDIAAAEKELALARADLALADANMELALIKAPTDGKIIEIFAYGGETIGDNGALALAETSKMMVEAQVYITDIRKVKLGAAAVITGDGLSEKISGKVTEITEMVDFNSVFSPDPVSFADKRIVKVKIKLDRNEMAAGIINSQVNVEIYGE